MVGHRICSECWSWVNHLKVEDSHLLPVSSVLRLYIYVLVIYLAGRNIYLDVTAAAEVNVLTLWEFNNKLLNECGNVVVADNCALPLLNSQYLRRKQNAQVLLYLNLAAQSPVGELLLTCKEAGLSREDTSATADYLALTHTAVTLSTASGRQVNLLLCKCGKECSAGCNLYLFFTVVNVYGNVSARKQFCLGKEQ